MYNNDVPRPLVGQLQSQSTRGRLLAVVSDDHLQSVGLARAAEEKAGEDSSDDLHICTVLRLT